MYDDTYYLDETLEVINWLIDRGDNSFRIHETRFNLEAIKVMITTDDFSLFRKESLELLEELSNSTTNEVKKDHLQVILKYLKSHYNN